MKISPKWQTISKAIFGITTGRHCHWCSKIEYSDAEAFCPVTKREKIHSWDGAEIARECNQFRLSYFYTTDKTHEKVFNEKTVQD